MSGYEWMGGPVTWVGGSVEGAQSPSDTGIDIVNATACVQFFVHGNDVFRSNYSPPDLSQRIATLVCPTLLLRRWRMRRRSFVTSLL